MEARAGQRLWTRLADAERSTSMQVKARIHWLPTARKLFRDAVRSIRKNRAIVTRPFSELLNFGDCTSAAIRDLAWQAGVGVAELGATARNQCVQTKVRLLLAARHTQWFMSSTF